MDLSEQFIPDLRERVKEWAANPHLGVAADLLNFSHLPEAKEILCEPARFIAARPELVPLQLSRVARTILEIEADSDASSEIGCQREISQLRKRLVINPRDAIALIDMARCYAALGQNQQAERAVLTAAALQPHHRFVLRSASRFFVHNGDPERALFTLNRSERTREDPWLLASLIAIETVLDRTPRFFKKAKIVSESSKFAPQHLSELGAALATVHVNSGDMKLGKKFFNRALAAPNDNAVAQAVWASTEFKMPMHIRPEWLTGRFFFEAHYYALVEEGDFGKALEAAVDWFQDEPFSSRPLRGAAFSASVLGHYKKAEECTRQALMLDPQDMECQNNLVFALAGQNRLDEASALLANLWNLENESGSISGHTLANMGMICYRSGQIELGRRYYKEAVALLESQKKSESRDIAAAYWLQEAKLVGDPEFGNIAVTIEPALQKSASSAARAVFNRSVHLTELAQVSNSQMPPLIRSAISWEHDASKNVLFVKSKDAFNSKK